MLVKDFEDELALELSDRDEDTIAGLVLSELGRSPEVGDRARIGPLAAEVREISGNRIVRLRVRVDRSERDARAGS
jgi:CBS domain containing-hemolysin-like protein